MGRSILTTKQFIMNSKQECIVNHYIKKIETMKILISMREKVLQLESQLKICISEGMSFTDLQTLKQNIQTQIFLFANFLSLKLELWMFVPCKFIDGVLVVLESPDLCNYHIDEEGSLLYNLRLKEYQEAKDRVLFEGFEFSHDNDYNSVVRQKTDSGIKVEIQFRKYEKDVRIIVNGDYIHDCGSIERLIGLDTKPILTPTAKKQIGL